MEEIKLLFDDHLNTIMKSKTSLSSKIEEVCIIIKSAILSGNKVLLFGNGGSAGDAQHIAAEFTGRFIKERVALPAIALTTDTSAITAIGNDYGFDQIFQRVISGIEPKKIKWTEGKTVIIDNWKVLHGRKSAEKNTTRMLKRIYINQP